MTLIVIEGPDGAGKTTLAQKLADDLDGVYLHNGKPQSYADLSRHFEVLREAAYAPRVTIADRCPWVSEAVYSGALQRQCRVSPHQLAGWEAIPHMLVYCSGPLGDLQEGKEYKDSEHMAQVKALRQTIIERYEGFFRFSYTGHLVKYNRDQMAYRQVLGLALRWMHQGSHHGARAEQHPR